MKTLSVLSVFLTCLLAAPALAGVSPQDPAPRADTTAVSAVRALLTRCLPAVTGDVALGWAGLTGADPGAARTLLGQRPGRAWSGDRGRLLIAEFADAPLCRVVALDVDPAVMTDLVIRLFSGTPFVRQRFRLYADGGFAAVYTGAGAKVAVVLRLSTGTDAAGRRIAILSAERAAP